MSSLKSALARAPGCVDRNLYRRLHLRATADETDGHRRYDFAAR